MGRISRVLPKEWVQYKAVGTVIPNTRFFVFKTPLSAALSTKVPKEKRFQVPNLLHEVASRGLSLGMVIDLTDTDRYYEKRDIEGMCILYEKINCPGRGFIERDDLVDAFCTIIDNYLEANSDNDTVIGIHCTNGVNRSGYLICRFLIDRLNWSSHDAIDAFERARGYSIERGSYVLALHKAAKERSSRKRHKYSDEIASSDESEAQKLAKKRAKHSKKHKGETSGDENATPDMEAVLNQMAIAFEQHQSSINSLNDQTPASYKLEAVSSSAVEVQLSQNSSQISAENSPFVGSAGTVDDEDEDDASVDPDGQGAEDGESEITKSKKRRERRMRLQKQFNLMKTGNFWKINEMQKEKFGN